MAIGAFDSDAFDTDAFFVDAFLFTDAGVTVPDVVGLTQAAGSTAITDLGLTVSVSNAYSSTVAAGLIISQNPTSGTEVAPGSNVAIIVSLGPQSATETTGGGWYFHFELENRRRRKRQQELDEIEEEQERIEDSANREIARLLQIQERKDAERADLERIRGLVKQYESVSSQEINSERVERALKAAQEKQSRANLERLQREFARMVEEEDEFLTVLFLLANE